MERLDKYLCSQSTTTRREAGRLIRAGHVTVDGAVCRVPDTKIDPAAAQVAVDGKPLSYAACVYWMLNKPAGILCVSRDPKAPTVVDLLPPEQRRRGLFPAGRLDKDTHGLVLLTDDGDFAHAMLSPRRHIPKTYHAVLDKPLSEEAADAFRAGPTLADGTVCLPAEVRVLEEGEQPLVEVVIFEGKFHQIKRMFAAVGCHVEWLKRVAMGGLLLDNSLPEGAARPLTEEEKMSIFTKKSPPI
ncbi:MAG: rRNA pseudouridine synthase [Clostridia bacterium]|nr:rRNA pseudouridine synthase [Clostridia bacterium]